MRAWGFASFAQSEVAFEPCPNTLVYRFDYLIQINIMAEDNG